MAEQYRGSATTYSGERVNLSAEQAKALWEQAEEEKAKREADMPTTDDALLSLCSAKHRLRELGWSDGIHCPKDGSEFAMIEFGSTGIFSASYHGEWPQGMLLAGDYSMRPEGVMWRAINKLTEAERSKMVECAKREAEMIERDGLRFAALEKS